MISKSRAWLRTVLVALVVGIVAFIGGIAVAVRWGDMLPLSSTTNQTASAQRTTPADLQTDFATFWEVWNLVDSKFYHTQPFDRQHMVYGAITGMLHSLGDDYTVFEAPDTAANTRERLSGQLEGIGAYIDYVNGALTIVSPIEGSPAEQAKIQAGDIIMKVDNAELAPLLHGLDRTEATTKAASLIRGPKGSTVHLAVLRPATKETLAFDIQRDAVPLVSVRAKLLDNKVAYVQISEFKETTVEELDRALNGVLAQQPTSIVLDLRNNPGGLLSTAQEVLGRFLPDGTALIEKFGDGHTQTIAVRRGKDAPSAFKEPLVVLVNGGSASASEIVAGALQDRGRAMLVGEKTFGKGSVQSIERLSNGASARITIAHWLTPNHTEIHKVGIAPARYVPFSKDGRYRVALPQQRPSDPAAVNDSQLWWAIRTLTTNEQPAFPTPTPTGAAAEATAGPQSTTLPEATTTP